MSSNKYLDKFTMKYNDTYVTIVSLFESHEKHISQGTTLKCKGWVHRARSQANLTFIEMYDGSCSQNLQIVMESKMDGLYPGTSIEVEGVIVKSPAKGQLFEMKCSTIKIVGTIDDPNTYLPCAKNVQIELLRQHCDIRTKFQSMRSIYRIRSKALEAVHEFFKKNKFFKLDPNVITTSDCEGAGETFAVTTLDPLVKNENYENDFFGKPAYLTVSSQLQLEALCSGMSKVYTDNMSFRAEKSQTNRHVACFTHVEWEIAFLDLVQLLNFNEDIITYVIAYVLDNAMDDLVALDKFISVGLIDKLKKTIEKPFVRITYTDALNIVKDNLADITKKYPTFEMPKWGDDLSAHCERYLADVVFKHPVLVYNYPKVLKSFYMKRNDDNLTVQSCDLLLPGVGEVIGSSIREDNYDKLMEVINERKMDVTPLQWYVDLRKNGTFEHGGAGLGFSRLIAYLTFQEGSIRDVIPFFTAYGICDY